MLASPLPWESPPPTPPGWGINVVDEVEDRFTDPLSPGHGVTVGRTQKNILSSNQRFLVQVLDAMTSVPLALTSPTLCAGPLSLPYVMSLCDHP